MTREQLNSLFGLGGDDEGRLLHDRRWNWPVDEEALTGSHVTRNGCVFLESLLQSIGRLTWKHRLEDDSMSTKGHGFKACKGNAWFERL